MCQPMRCCDANLGINFTDVGKNVLGSDMSYQPFEPSPPIYFLGYQTCPSCRETEFAAEGAEVDNDAINYRWNCDLCGHGFSTITELAPAAA